MRTTTLTAAGASLVAIAALTGCAPSDPAGGQVEFDPANPVTIQFWHTMNDPAQTALQDLVGEFEDSHPGITVDLVYQPYDAILPSIQTAIAAGEPPALSQMEVSTMAQLAGLGVLEPLEDLLTPEGAAEVSGDMEDSIVKVNSYDATHYTVPFGYSTNVLFYNVDLLASAGYDADSMPKTWDELIDAATAVHEANPGVLGFGFGAVAPWAFEMRLFQSGGEMFDADGTTAEFNSAEGVSVLENYQDLLATGAAEMMQTSPNFAELQDLFTTGRVAMWEQSSAALQGMTDAAPFEVGVAPYTTMGDDVSLLGGQNLGIFADIPDDQKAAAAEFIKWWTSADISAKWSVASGYLPGMKSAWDTDTLTSWLAEDPRREIAADQIPGMHARPNLPGYPEIATVIADAFQATLTGQGDAKSNLDAAAAKADEILAQNQ